MLEKFDNVIRFFDYLPNLYDKPIEKLNIGSNKETVIHRMATSFEKRAKSLVACKKSLEEISKELKNLENERKSFESNTKKGNVAFERLISYKSDVQRRKIQARQSVYKSLCSLYKSYTTTDDFIIGEEASNELDKFYETDNIEDLERELRKLKGIN